MAITEISVSKIYILATEPTNKVKDRFWFDTTNNLLKRYDGTSWKPISVSSDDVVVLSSGNKVSLTNYLNTQIAALAEGIDSKQDKLKFYSEIDKSSDTSVDSTGSEINLKTSPSQYGGSNINLIASNGQYNPGNINLKAKAWDTSNGSYITLESEGGSASGGNITLHSKVNTGGSAEPGGRIEIIADGSSAHATNNPGAGIITLNAKDGSALNGNESITFEGTINLNATKVQKNGADIATATDLATKQNTLQFYIESGEGTTSTAKITAYNFEVSSAQIKLDSEYGIDGNILEKTISETSSDNKIPTAKAVKTELDKKQDKLSYYSEVSGDTPSAIISVKNIKLDGRVAEGKNTTASGDYSHTEGFTTTASGDYSHTEGLRTTASGYGSHAEGFLTTASGGYSHTEGQNTTASGNYSHTEGFNTTASGDYQHVQGKYNIEDSNNKYADIIGNGSSESSSNAATISWEGISWSQTDVRAGGTDQDNATHSLSAKQNSTDNTLETIDKTIVGAINELNTQINTDIPKPITSIYTISSDSLSSIISNTTYAGVSGQILISADVENTGPILIGEGITDKANAFPIYPDQIFPIPFSDINNFKVTGNIGNKFNYIISFRSLNNTSPAVNGGITILNENGYYKLTPSGEGETATLIITKLK